MDTIKEGELKTLDIDDDYYNEVFERLPNVKEDKKEDTELQPASRRRPERLPHSDFH